MADGNKRYLGDVFINRENAEYQAQFFKDIIESYQYQYGGDFDAATLQGMVPSDFATAEQGLKAENALMAPLLIGQLANQHYLRNISDPNESQYIYTDGVLLEKSDGRLDAIDWYNNLVNDDVTDALESIFNNTINIRDVLQDGINTKANNTEFQNFKNLVSTVFEIYTENDEQVVKVDADSVNGLRFRLITQEDYDNLPQADKEYWRNIFIIRDNIPADYEDPMTWDLSDGYVFGINDGFLQFKNEMSDEWETICSLEDLFEGAGLLDIIKDYIEDNQDYIINGASLSNSLKDIPSSSITLQWQDYPFLSSSLHDDFIYKLKLNNSSDYVTETVDDNLFKNVNVDVNQILKDNGILGQDGTNIVNGLVTDLATQSTLLGETASALSTAQNDINTLKNNGTDLSTLESRITSLESTIRTANSNITALNTKINNLSKYTKYTGSFMNSGSDIYYNDLTKIAYVQVQMSYSHKKSNSGSWVKIGTLPSKFTPVQGFKVPNSPAATVYFKYNREIFCRVDIDSNVGFTLITGGAFYYS